MSPWTTVRVKALKGRQRIACVTAYDYTSARLADAAGLPLILVGDSLAATTLGYADTLPVTMDEMLHHTRAVTRGVREALVVADMPFMSYHASVGKGVANAGRFVKEARATAVKIEGGAFRVPLVETLIHNGIPVMGHIGLTPQSIKVMGGYRIQGRTPEEAGRLLDDAKALDDAGVFALVLECVPRALAAEITRTVSAPTIGIGAGPECDGQVLVFHDLLGLYPDEGPRLTFVKRYASLGATAVRALQRYRGDVEKGKFPTRAQSF